MMICRYTNQDNPSIPKPTKPIHLRNRKLDLGGRW